MTRPIIRRPALAGALVAVATSFVSTRPARAQDLEPPQPLPPTPPTVDTGTTNEADEKKDSGLGLEWVWLNADVGTAYANMTSFNSSALALQQSASSGPAFGVGAGVRLIFLSAGLRFTDMQLSAFNLYEINAEAAFHVRVWRIDPYFGVRGGYAFVGSLNSGSVAVATGSSMSNVSSSVAVHGIDVGPMVGIDVYFAHWISIGLDGQAQFLFIQRPPAPIPSVPASVPPAEQQAAKAMIASEVMSNPLYQQSGSSVGLGLTGMAHLGIHF